MRRPGRQPAAGCGGRQGPLCHRGHQPAVAPVRKMPTHARGGEPVQLVPGNALPPAANTGFQLLASKYN